MGREGHELALCHFKIDILHRDHRAILLADTANFQKRRHAFSPLRTRAVISINAMVTTIRRVEAAAITGVRS